nr:putative hAT dimerization domain, ribonuclease H-like domain protein [Tanacetum cinerariifolium]
EGKEKDHLPFNLARNPHYLRAFQFAAANKIDGYVPPGYNKLRTTLLQKEKDNVHRQLEPLRSTWKEKGVTIMSDGWSDPTRKPLINFMATSGNGPLFLKAMNCFGEVKDRFFIADLIKEVINEIGHQNVVQIITDNAANCKAVGQLIESQFPHIYWTPCVVHTLNLAVKNICSPSNVETNALAYEQCNWIKDVHGDALAIKNFIMNHNMRLSIFSKFTPLRLLSVVDTRFASIIMMLKRLKLIKTGLPAMVISKEWSSYREDDTVKANFVKEKIVNDEWWDKVSYILSFTRPIYEMIRACDTDKPCLHLVYEMWDSMIEKVKIEIYKKEKCPTSQLILFYDVVHGILVARWAKNNTSLHCLAHSLNPSFLYSFLNFVDKNKTYSFSSSSKLVPSFSSICQISTSLGKRPR